MAIITAEYVRHALDAQRVWDLGNAVLYRLCADHPCHTIENIIIAKMWLIGRSYAVAIERRRGKGKFLGDSDAFYVEHVAPKILQANVDAWFQELSGDEEQTNASVLRVHNNLTKLLNDITGENRRSFASKYLHFHFPERFFIYDGRAAATIRKLTRGLGARRKRSERFVDSDPEYADFVDRCEQLSRDIGAQIGRNLAPRELDKVLLFAWSRPPVRQEEVEAQPSSGQQMTPEIPGSQFARIRSLVKYGMTVSQVAEVYEVAVGEIERVLRKA